LRAAWTDRGDIRWSGQRDKADVLRVYADHDVLVMPSRGEGLPVALLEAGAAGVVPVVSDLASGIPDVVTAGVSGYRPGVGDIGGFADAIAALDRDRARVEQMSGAIRETVATHFDADERTAGYQRLFARWQQLKRPRPVNPRLAYGSRLDQRWMPNAAVRMIRSAFGRR
jgi:glycosyltransferase involved in cell wall biosynthesis